MTEFVAILNHALLFLILYAEVFLLIAFLESKEGTESTTLSDNALPSVTILVPCFNEEKTVAGTLRSLLALDYPREKISIIAINDGSTDNTHSVLEQFAEKESVTVLKKPNGGKYTALNVGLARCTSDIVGVLDADSFVTPSTLRTAIAHMVHTRASAVTPGLVVANPRSLLGLAQQAEYILSLFMRKAFASADAVLVTPGSFTLFRRETVSALGGWRHAHGSEDLDIAWRMREHNLRITNAPHAHVLTTTPQTVRNLFTQRIRWTYGFLMNAWDYRYMIGNTRYGALGTIVIPSALIAIFAILYFTVFVLLRATEEIYTYVLQVEAGGFLFSTPQLFFFNTTSLALISYTLVTLACALLFTGRSISQSPLHPFAVPLYFLYYSFLTPLWIFGAVARVSLRAPAPWR